MVCLVGDNISQADNGLFGGICFTRRALMCFAVSKQVPLHFQIITANILTGFFFIIQFY